MSDTTLAVRCPRCADRIELPMNFRTRLIFTYSPQQGFITADVAVTGLAHTCADVRESA